MKQIQYNAETALSEYFTVDKNLIDVDFDDSDHLVGELTISFNNPGLIKADSKSIFSGSSLQLIYRIKAFLCVNFSNGNPTKESLNRMFFSLKHN